MKIEPYIVRPYLEQDLKPLADLAMNMWYTWNWRAVELFIRIDEKLWEESYHNPVAVLGRVSQERLRMLQADDAFMNNLKEVYDDYLGYICSSGWFIKNHRESALNYVAYLSLEFGIDEIIPIYSGGLGVLAGDHLKAASDLSLPIVGVGLLYQQGYFQQYLSHDGWQREMYVENDWYNMPVELMKDGEGKARTISVKILGEDVVARIWRVQIGRVPLYLLDTNVEQNSPANRQITYQLYGGDREMRMRQEILLGVGGLRALREFGIRPSVFHMNEGHSAFLLFERLRRLMQEENLTLQEAREVVWSSTVFTTHTPVPAGNERFDFSLMKTYWADYCKDLGINQTELKKLGQEEGRDGFCMTTFALRHSSFLNGVSALHGKVSRKMWMPVWPDLPEEDVPIRHITNGIHTMTWLSHDLAELFQRYLGPRIRIDPDNLEVWNRVDNIPDMELWRVHQRRRLRLVFFARQRLEQQLRRRGAPPADIASAEEVLDPGALTIGFARRFATYKRGTLLLRHLDRLKKLCNSHDRPVQFIFAGKAHPQDTPGKEIIKELVQFASEEDMRMRFVFLENYDMNVARYLVQGCDVWLNTPRRPKEASGTSGMKAAANGVLNCSVLDGWWVEAADLDVGWTIGAGEEYDETQFEAADEIESLALFDLLEREIVPLFYDRDRNQLPRGWIRKMKNCIRELGPRFNTDRMVCQYAEGFYLPAAKSYWKLAENNFQGARELAAWRDKVGQAWDGCAIKDFKYVQMENFRIGDTFPVTVWVDLNGLEPGDVMIQLLNGMIDATGQLANTSKHLLTLDAREESGSYRYTGEIHCAHTGRQGFALRITPCHEDMPHCFRPGWVRWY